MKAYSKYIALAAVAVSFAACQQEEMDITSQDDLVRIEATIGNLPQTRVTYDDETGGTNFMPGDAIRVKNTTRGNKNEATYTLGTDGTTWTPDASLVWDSKQTNTFKAWYPADEATYTTFTIPTDQNTNVGVACADWMTATKSTTKPSDNKLELKFFHRLTMVTVSVTDWGDEIATDNQKLTGAQIYTPTVITWDGEENSLPTGTDEKWITPYVASDGQSINAIICPGTPATDSEIWLKVTAANGNTYNVKFGGNYTSLDAGKHYAYNLKVGKDLAVIESVTVNDWGNGGEITAPDAEEDK